MIALDNLVVQGFWHGPLTTMERLSIKSFLAHGHELHLYVYNQPIGVPAGVILKDAREILPESEMATFRCVQQFSDWFRIKLLLDKGGWNTDLDNVLLKPLDFESEFVFYRDHDESTISLALAKAPAGASISSTLCGVHRVLEFGRTRAAIVAGNRNGTRFGSYRVFQVNRLRTARSRV